MDFVCVGITYFYQNFNSAKISDRLAHRQVAKGLPEKGLVVL
ncbi:hypothetical protein [Nostoc sp.]